MNDGSEDIFEYQEFTKSRRTFDRIASIESERTNDGGYKGSLWKESSNAIASTSLDQRAGDAKARGLMVLRTLLSLGRRWTVKSPKAKNRIKDAALPVKKAQMIRRREGKY